MTPSQNQTDQDSPDGASSFQDLTGTQFSAQTDSGMSPDAQALPDSAVPVPDTVLPQADTAQPPPPPPPPDPPPDPPPSLGNPGDPCPCQGSTMCFEGICRSICNTPTDACGAVASCPSDQACVSLTSTDHGVCLPAAKPGQACGTGTFCPVNHVCGSVNNSPFICLPICSNAGGLCANGSLCLEVAGGCAFCTSP